MVIIQFPTKTENLKEWISKRFLTAAEQKIAFKICAVSPWSIHDRMIPEDQRKNNTNYPSQKAIYCTFNEEKENDTTIIIEGVTQEKSGCMTWIEI